LRYEWNYTSTPIHVLAARCLTEHRDNVLYLAVTKVQRNDHKTMHFCLQWTL
jgi:hypothetical protein